MTKLFKIYYYTDVMKGYGVGETIAYVKAEDEEDAFNGHSHMGVGIQEVREDELEERIEMLKAEITRNEKLLADCLEISPQHLCIV
jgi:uncharacterized small protein (DUF1192 family)